MFKKLFYYFFQNNNDKIKLEKEIEAFKAQITIPAVPKDIIKFEKQLKLRIENALSRYDFIKKEKISFLASELVNDNFKYSKDILSLEEKRTLRLNTRAKYTRSFVECFSNIEQLNFDPRFFCQNLIYTERTILFSLNDIDRLKKSKFVKQVIFEKQIISEGREEWVKNEYSLDEIPDFELVDYTRERVLFFILSNIDLDNTAHIGL